MLRLVNNEISRMFAKKKMFIFILILLAFTLTLSIGIKSVQLIGNLPPEEVPQMTGQDMPMALLAAGIDFLLPVFLIILISDMFTEEYKNGTLKLPLLHPVSRQKVFLSKILALTIFVLILIVFQMITGYLVGTLFFEWGEGLNFINQVFEPTKGILLTIQSYGMSMLPILAFGMLVTLLSILINNSGAVVGSSIGIVFIFNIAGQLSDKISPYLINTHFKWFINLFQQGVSKTVIFSLTIILIYALVFLSASLWSFKRKDIVN